MENVSENKTVKIIKDLIGDNWNALVIIGRVAIVQTVAGKYVQMFCDRSKYKYGSDNTNGWSFGSGYVLEYNTLQDACNAIHPDNVI